MCACIESLGMMNKLYMDLVYLFNWWRSLNFVLPISRSQMLLAKDIYYNVAQAYQFGFCLVSDCSLAKHLVSIVRLQEMKPSSLTRMCLRKISSKYFRQSWRRGDLGQIRWNKVIHHIMFMALGCKPRKNREFSFAHAASTLGQLRLAGCNMILFHGT